MAGILRTVYVLATVVVVCAALAQVVGRLVAANLPALQAPINQQLAERGIRLSGLSGSWHGLNPGFSVERIDFPAGHLTDVMLEFDVVESLLRNRLIARRIHVADGVIGFDRTADGWRLRDTPVGNLDFDVRALVEHSDEIVATAALDFRHDDRRGKTFVELRGVNRGGRHRWETTVATRPDCGPCGLRVELEMVEAIIGIQRESGVATLHADDLVVGAGLAATLGVPGFELEIDGRWQSRGARGSARIQAAVRDAAFPGGPSTFTLRGHARSAADGIYLGAVTDLEINTATDAVGVDDINFRAAPEARIEIWTQTLSLDEIGRLIASSFGTELALGEWFAALDMGGSVADVRAIWDRGALSYSASFTDLRLSTHRGVPDIGQASGQIVGTNRALRINVASRDMSLRFPELFNDGWRYERADGPVTLYLGLPEYFGIRGENLGMRFGESAATGGFAFARPADPLDHTLVIAASIDQADIETAGPYIPQRLPGGLDKWLKDSLQFGRLQNTELVFGAHTRARGDLPIRRFELKSDVREGAIAYHPDWPAGSAADGRVEVTGDEIRVDLTSASVFEVQLQDVVARVPLPAQWVDVSFRASIATASALDFVRSTPIAEMMPFVTADWVGAGRAAVDVDLRVRLDGVQNPGDIELAFDLDNVTVAMQELGLEFEAFSGRGRYTSPYDVQSRELVGTAFGYPASARISSPRGTIAFQLFGSATVDDVYRLFEVDPLAELNGEFDYVARYTVFPESDRPTELDIDSGLIGVTSSLPAPLAKSFGSERPVATRLQFLQDHVAIAIDFDQSLFGWLHVGSERLLRGSLGIGAEPVMVDETASRLVVTGTLDRFDVGVGDDDGDGFAWQAQDLRVGTIGLGDFELHAARVNGFMDDAQTHLQIDSTEMTGEVRKNGSAPWQIHIAQARVESSAGAGDPLDVALIDGLPAADFVIDRVALDGEDYGAWQFSLRSGDAQLRLLDLAGDIRGLRIEAVEDVVWDRASNKTTFQGTVTGQDLADVLPLWDYPALIKSTTMTMVGHTTWPGSPLNFDLGRLSGDLDLEITQGRFLEQGGVAKVMSLMGFNAVTAVARIENGLLEFVEPMTMDGTGSSFKIEGTVSLADGTLNNDMTVTLPVTKGLPWYAAYVAFANPALGVGVMLGRTIFSDQIDQISSARYRLEGTLEEPNMRFVSIFDLNEGPADPLNDVGTDPITDGDSE